MIRMLPLVLVGVVAASGVARADGLYFTEAIGGSKIKDQLSAYLPSAMHVHVGVGARHGSWALEGYAAGDIATDADNYASLTTYGLDLKYIRPLASHLEVYLRGSASHGALYGAGNGDDYSGRGLGFGAGVQLKGKVRALGFLWFPLFFTGVGPKVTAALYIDDGYDFYRLHDGGVSTATSIDAQITTVMAGFSVGTDF